MSVNATFAGQFIICFAIINTLLTLRSAKKAGADNLMIIGFIAITLNLFIFPVGWFYTYLWSRRLYKKNLLDKQS
ncbi:hypothetical protein [Pseudoalteromonas denitrificans]|uniref:Phospholipase_D-nuclease N-terminal n=1 Tax=Pseudoalteromonas denitrificans DSM 6059 TaxID=1123010 RepID=A0A1I1S6N7_9GAMM|nr:hypothetical protein [Pseudoalteromonas denitrificans]SFD42171.1 hypothetical protein SAMN02745724_04474 [Pseudoalteromonas denitrificans DSM 6059]